MSHGRLDELQERIAKYDLLSHPFYKAWSAGELTRDDLREYACDYYRHVEAFPSYLAEFADRLPEERLKNAVLGNMMDELGQGPQNESRSHAELWLDFAEGMGASRQTCQEKPAPEISELIALFHSVATTGTEEEALAAFYAYESQVPRIATEKERGLRAFYEANDRTCRYFTLHAVADVYHADTWKEELSELISANPETGERALESAETAAQALWRALDGIDARRQVRRVL